MSHWLDDAARGLSEGRFSRRDVLRRGGAVAAGTLVASVTGPLRTVSSATAASRRAGSTIPCPGLENVCFSPEICCGGNNCCDEDKCCGHTECCKEDELCCGGKCRKGGDDYSCCGDDSYNRLNEQCCPEGRGHLCFVGVAGTHNETCCGTTECCKEDEECCHSGKLAYCAPKGKCCREGQHRVTCGTGKALCCPEGQYCCGGVCCTRANCNNGVCGQTGRCAPYCGDPGAGPACGPGVHDGCCPPGQCCVSSFNYIGAITSEICCPESITGQPVTYACGDNCCQTPTYSTCSGQTNGNICM